MEKIKQYYVQLRNSSKHWGLIALSHKDTVFFDGLKATEMVCVIPPDGCVELTQNLFNAPGLFYVLFLWDRESNGRYRVSSTPSGSGICDVRDSLDIVAEWVAQGDQPFPGWPTAGWIPKRKDPTGLREKTILQHQEDAPGFETTSIKHSITRLCKGYSIRGRPKFVAFQNTPPIILTSTPQEATVSSSKSKVNA